MSKHQGSSGWFSEQQHYKELLNASILEVENPTSGLTEVMDENKINL